MAPILSEATAAVIVLATVLLSPEPATADRRFSTSSTSSASSSSTSSSRKTHGRRQRHQPPVADKVIAWGQRHRAGYSNQIQAEASMASRDGDLGDAGVAVADGSWTHSAFRAFHELRAGLPPSLLHADGAEEGGGGGKEGSEDSFGAGPLGGLRRLASGMPRSLGQALGRKPPDDTDEQPQQQHQRRRHRRKQHVGADQVALPAAQNGKTPIAGASSTTTTLAAAPKATTTTTATSTTAATPADTSSTSPPACWHMQGRLTNTATGQTIALVEGVELVRSLAFETAPEKRGRGKAQEKRGSNESPSGSNTTEGKGGGREVALTKGAAAEGGQGGGEELEVDRALKPGMWTAFGALATSKFFMYQNPDTGEPMDYYRNTPVEKKQMVRTYERFSQVVSHLLQPNGRMLVVSEWGGRSVKAETANSNGVEELDGGGNGFGFGNSKGGLSLPSSSSSSSAPRRVFNLHFFVEARTPKEERALKRWEERPAAKWIAFGATPPRAHGCKEIYSYVTGGGGGASRGVGTGQREKKGRERKRPRGGGSGETVAATAGAGKGAGSGGLMSYTRYGECPTWYGTGRMCGLDVQARRVGSFRSLPAKLRAKVLEIDPDFERGPPGTLEECRSIAQREREEREEGRRKRSLWRPFRSSDSGGK